MSLVLRPLLKLIGEITGLPIVTLVGGKPPDSPTDPYVIAVVNEGKSKELMPRDFTDQAGAGFSDNFIGEFAKFLYAASGEFLNATCAYQY